MYMHVHDTTVLGMYVLCICLAATIQIKFRCVLQNYQLAMVEKHFLQWTALLPASKNSVQNSVFAEQFVGCSSATDMFFYVC